MNTKSSEISSGLVAHIAAFKEAMNGTKGDLDAWLECNNEAEVRQAIFGVISDLSRSDRYGACDECGTPYSFDPTDGGTICVKCQKDKITKQAERIKELEEQCRTNHSMEIDSLSRKCDEQSAALKLAKKALDEIVDDAKCYVERTACGVSWLTAGKEALAAIDALGEVK